MKRLLVVAGVVLALCLEGCSGERRDKTTADEPASSAKACDMRWSETEIAARQATGLVSDMDVNSGGLTITVDQNRLAQRPEGTLESLVEAADCALAGPTGHLTRIEVVGDAGGSPIATYSAVELLEMREATEPERALSDTSQPNHTDR